MHHYKDLSRLTAVAVGCVAIYMIVELLFGVVRLYDTLYAPAPDPMEAAPTLVAALGVTLAFLSCVIVVGRWIYRASANAHAISDEMTISPGWAVGSYFVPILNLFRPYQAMREVWLASHFRGNWHAEPTPSLLIAWWALWIITNILGNLAWRLDASNLEAALIFDVTGAVLNAPLSVALIVLMRRIARAQAGAGYDEVFA